MGWYEWSHRDHRHVQLMDRVMGFNAAVEAWEDHYYAAFKMFMKPRYPEVHGLALSAGADALQLVPKRASEVSSNSLDVRKYNALRYSYTGPLLAASPRSPFVEAAANFSLVSPHAIRGLPADFALTYNDTFSLGNWKQCVHNRKGAYEVAGRNMCTVYYRLRTLCFIVQYVDDHWEYDGGCLAGGKYANYAIVNAPRRDRPAVVDFSNVTITLRHAKDPYLHLHAVSDGTLSFGTSRDEADQAATAMFAVACVLVLVCAAIFVLNKSALQPVTAKSTARTSQVPRPKASQDSQVRIDMKT